MRIKLIKIALVSSTVAIILYLNINRMPTMVPKEQGRTLQDEPTAERSSNSQPVGLDATQAVKIVALKNESFTRHSNAGSSLKTHPVENDALEKESFAETSSEPSSKAQPLADDTTKLVDIDTLAAYKIYVYDLPHQFNEDILKCHENHTCYDSSEAGYGDVIDPGLISAHKEFPDRAYDGVVFRNTWHGLLELTMHRRLLRSPRRTHDPEEADAFYIPYYPQMLQRCTNHKEGTFGSPLYSKLRKTITQMPYFQAGKPHFTTLGQPETFGRVRVTPPWLSTVLTITLEVFHRYRAEHPTRSLYPTLVAPYQSIVHFKHKSGAKHYMDAIIRGPRKAFIFFAGNTRLPTFSALNNFRYNILQQIPNMTDRSYHDYLQSTTTPHSIDAIMFRIPRVCDQIQAWRIIEWMQNSVFCLQPPGDTFTRKSFFDSVLSGCVPVLFQTPNASHVTYPFDTLLVYSSFAVTVPYNATFRETLEPYKNAPIEVRKLQVNLAKVAKYLQYNDITAPDMDVDAFHLLLHQVGEHFKLGGSDNEALKKE